MLLCFRYGVMKTRALLLWLMLTLLVQDDADGKRFDPSMVDPLMRRSPLDKNFMRFGRSSPSFVEEEDGEIPQGSSGETSKEENFIRSMRGKQDSFMRFGRSRNDNFMRFGRGKQDGFMRFGKSKNDNFMRFGRGKQDNFMRFGRGKQDNFMRFGRGKQDNFMRFGKGKQDNFMRFGKGNQGVIEFTSDLDGHSALPFSNVDVNMRRDMRGKQDNFMRFGKSVGGYPGNEIQISMRSDPKSNMNFIRFGKAKPDDFMSFGKPEGNQKQMSLTDEEKDSIEKLNEGFARDIKSKDLKLIRLGRQHSNKDNSFMRFGRNPQGQTEESTLNLIPQRLKRSAIGFFETPGEIYPRNFKDELNDRIYESIVSLPEGIDEEYVEDDHEEGFISRKKRSLTYKSPTVHPPVESNPIDDISSKYVLNTASKTEFPPSLISAGLPNIIVGPEFSLLPDLDPPSTMLKKNRLGDQGFLRLG